METDSEALQQRDIQQAEDQFLLSRRGHYTMRQRLLKRLIRDVWGDGGLLEGAKDGLTKADISARMTDFMQFHLADMVTFFGWRADQSHQPVSILRWMLGQIGIMLESEQVMRDGQRFRVYKVNEDALEKQRNYATLRRLHLHQQQQEKDRQRITQNVVVVYNPHTESIPDEAPPDTLYIPF